MAPQDLSDAGAAATGGFRRATRSRRATTRVRTVLMDIPDGNADEEETVHEFEAARDQFLNADAALDALLSAADDEDRLF